MLNEYFTRYYPLHVLCVDSQMGMQHDYTKPIHLNNFLHPTLHSSATLESSAKSELSADLLTFQ